VSADSKFEQDARWMSEACALAAEGLGKTRPNPPVGCVLVKNGRRVAAGFHRKAGGPHAEAVAIAEAGAKANGATAYVTLEPCSHHGRTPPCADALIAAGVRRVVIACTDPNPSVRGRGAGRLRRAGVEVVRGVGEDKANELIRGFRSLVREGRPWLHLKLASTLDGRIATATGESKWISSPESRRRVQEMRARSDGVLVGVETVLSDDPRLNCRIRGATDPVRIVADRRLRTPVKSRVVTRRGSALIVCGKDAPAAARRRLERAGAEVLPLRATGAGWWNALLEELGDRGMLEVLVEGGGRVAASALRAGVVNAMTIFYNPRVIGADGVPVVGDLGVRRMQDALKPRSWTWGESGADLVWNGVFR
jgi:diaminohydroxyphosphoribosylaminopyrimidine deaminase/5-amino-6-(5-phosphoribosylamino)uracil reductase